MTGGSYERVRHLYLIHSLSLIIYFLIKRLNRKHAINILYSKKLLSSVFASDNLQNLRPKMKDSSLACMLIAQGKSSVR